MHVLGEILKYRANFSPKLEALVGEHCRYTYLEYNNRVNQLAHFLLELGVKKGDRIAILCNNHPNNAIISLATYKIGAIAVPLNWKLTSSELEYMVTNCQPKALFYDKEFEESVAFIKNLSIPIHLFIAAFSNDTHPLFEAMISTQSVKEPEIVVNGQDPAAIIYSSGTTGNPKGAILSHIGLYTSSVGASAGLRFSYKERYLAVTPLFHISGPVVMIASILYEMTMVFRTQFNPTQIWDVIEKERINHLMTVPSILIYMLPELIASDRDYSSLKTFACGGLKVSKELITQYDRLGYSITQLYGSAEAGGVLAYWSADLGMEYADSIGKPLLFTEVRIVDHETKQDVPVGVVGEIACRGPNVFLGYWNNQEETEKVLQNGWYFTEDAGKMDDHGHFYMLDRYKDIIICGGDNIYPAQVENVIRELDGVLEVALIGIPHKIWGEIPRAYIVRRSNANITRLDVQTYCGKRVAHFRYVNIRFVDELPKNGFGKVLKHVLREQVAKELGERTED